MSQCGVNLKRMAKMYAFSMVHKGVALTYVVLRSSSVVKIKVIGQLEISFEVNSQALYVFEVLGQGQS